MKLGQYFREMCINQKEFARKVGVTPVTICNIIYQRGGLNLATALRIEDVTEGKVTCRDLVNPSNMKILELKSKHMKKEIEPAKEE